MPKAYAEALASLPGGAEALAGIPAEVRVGIERAPRVAWVPFEWLIAVARAAAEAGGTELVEQVAREGVRRSLDLPLFRPLVRGAVAAFGGSAATLFRALPTAWKVSNRHTGTMTVGLDGANVSLYVRELAEVGRDPAFVGLWVGTSVAIANAGGNEATAVGDSRALASGQLDIRVELLARHAEEAPRP